MVTVPDRCGWFMAFLLQPGDYKLHLAEISGADSYGKGGYGSAVPYDLAAEFAAKGNNLWLDTDLNGWTGAWPNKDGDCQYLMAATVRDFSKEHPDFDFGGLTGDHSVSGVVEKALGPDRHPVRSSKAVADANLFTRFDSWWKTDPANATPALRSYETCADIPMSKSNDGLWEYDSYRTPQHGFYPIDDFNTPKETLASCYNIPSTSQWVTNQPAHNMNFCLESHASFIYKKGQRFSFRGDDDVWVFINEKLVIDLGGIHVPKSDSVNLDTLGLAEGKEYKWDFFYCERQPCGSSLRIKTSIFFRQQKSLFTEEDPAAAGVRFRIRKREGGKGSCATVDTATRVVDPANLTYQLLDANGKLVRELADGSFYGGITIATPNVSVDTAKIKGLDAGVYRIVAFEPANEKVRVEIPFKVSAHEQVEFDPPYSRDTLVGSVVEVRVSNREAGAVSPKAGTYTLMVPAGLQVYADAAKTLPILTGSILTTSGDGTGALFATADSSDPVDKTYVLEIAGSGKKESLTFRMPPLDLPKAVAAGIYDDDGDGIGDRIAAEFDRDISAAAPKGIAARWPAAAAPVSAPAADVAGMIAGKGISWKGRFSESVRTDGEGAFSATYPARGKDSTRTIPMADHIGPIILTAEISLGKSEDTLRIRFSEAVATGSITAAPGGLFAYKRSQDGAAEGIDPASLTWGAGNTEAVLVFPNASADAPRSGNLVRIEDGPGCIADARGNSAGPASRFRVISGGKRSEIQTVTYREIAPEGGLLREIPVAPILEPTNSAVAEVVDRTGRMGHLIKTDLGGYAVKDDFTKVEPSQVVLEYQASYFTNLGVPVAGDKRSIACTDDLFHRDCLNNRGFVFVGWNYTARDGAKVATGAYVARLRYQVKVAGKVVENGGLDQVWGILRKR
jgi:fibro-slime domain-containing protein